MLIEEIKLRDFRNYGELTLHPHPGVNLLFGQNGSGKTNLLEAVHYCALGRSHRTSQDREVVRKGAEEAKVAIRGARRDAMEQVKKLKKDSKITEDDQRKAEDELQKITDAQIKEIDKIAAEKEKEIMEV